MFVKPRYNKEKGVALCYSSRVVVTKNYREFRLTLTPLTTPYVPFGIRRFPNNKRLEPKY